MYGFGLCNLKIKGLIKLFNGYKGESFYRLILLKDENYKSGDWINSNKIIFELIKKPSSCIPKKIIIKV